MSASSWLTVKTLGVPGVSLGDRLLDVQGNKLALLVYLALQGEATREQLAHLLWSDVPDDTARRNLRVQLYRFRSSELADWLVETPTLLKLKEGVRVDVLEFREALAAAQFGRAAALVRGNFLEGLTLPSAAAFEEWRGSTASVLRDEQWRALDSYAQELVQAGKPQAALALREQAVRLDPLRERSVRALMELLLSMRQFDAAVNAYVSLSQRLHDELGVSPLPATQALRERVEQVRANASRAGEAQPETLTVFPMPLVGREREQQALRGHALVLVQGEAGLGKSRLVLETAGREALVLRSAPELKSLPFGALFEYLRQNWQACPPGVQDVLRPLQQPSLTAPLTALELGDRSALLDALALALLGVVGEGILIVEDIHWLDASTLECVLLASFRGVRRVWLTARTSELLERPELEALLKARQVPRLSLTELTESQVGHVIQRMAGQDAPLFSRRLHLATAGNPLFLIETLRGLRERGELTTGQGVWQTPYDSFTVDYGEVPVPPTVSEAITERVERLGVQTRQLLQAGATWGEVFPAELVAAVCGLEVGAALDALERAETARLVVPQGTLFRFGHDLYRRAVLGGVGGPRARFLHAQLARLAPAGTPPGTVAGHYEQAGEGDLAWPQWRLAGQQAERLYSHAEAAALYRQALLNQPPERQQFELHYAISQLQRYMDDAAGQQLHLAHLRRLAHSLQNPDLQALCARRHAVYFTECDLYPQAVEEVQRALHDLGGRISQQRRAELLLEGGAALACLSRWGEAHDLLLSALSESRDHAPEVYTNTLYWVGYCRLELGDAQGAEEIYRESLELLPPGQFSRGRVLKLWKHGLSLRRLGRLDEARQQLEQAREEVTTLNFGSLRGVVLAELGLVVLAQGDVAGAAHLAELAAPLVEGDTEGMQTLAELKANLLDVQGRAANS